MTTDLAIPAALPATQDELVEYGRNCLHVGKIATEQFGHACQALLDGPGSWTQRKVAEAMRCSPQTVMRGLGAAGFKIREIPARNSGDHEPSESGSEGPAESEIVPGSPEPGRTVKANGGRGTRKVTGGKPAVRRELPESEPEGPVDGEIVPDEPAPEPKLTPSEKRMFRRDYRELQNTLARYLSTAYTRTEFSELADMLRQFADEMEGPANTEPDKMRDARQSWRNVCEAAEAVTALPKPTFGASEKRRMIRQLEAATVELRAL